MQSDPAEDDCKEVPPPTVSEIFSWGNRDQNVSQSVPDVSQQVKGKKGRPGRKGNHARKATELQDVIPPEEVIQGPVVTETPEASQAPKASEAPKVNTDPQNIEGVMVRESKDSHDSGSPGNVSAAVKSDSSEDDCLEVPAPRVNETPRGNQSHKVSESVPDDSKQVQGKKGRPGRKGNRARKASEGPDVTQSEEVSHGPMVTEAPEICQAPGASDSPKGNTAAGHIDDQMVTVGTDPHDSGRPENEAAAVQPDAAQDVSKEVPAPSENQTDVPDVPIKVQVKRGRRPGKKCKNARKPSKDPDVNEAEEVGKGPVVTEPPKENNAPEHSEDVMLTDVTNPHDTQPEENDNTVQESAAKTKESTPGRITKEPIQQITQEQSVPNQHDSPVRDNQDSPSDKEIETPTTGDDTAIHTTSE